MRSTALRCAGGVAKDCQRSAAKRPSFLTTTARCTIDTSFWQFFPERELYLSTKGWSLFLREGCPSLRNAFVSIWRIRSRVTASSRPTSSKV